MRLILKWFWRNMEGLRLRHGFGLLLCAVSRFYALFAPVLTAKIVDWVISPDPQVMAHPDGLDLFLANLADKLGVSLLVTMLGLQLAVLFVVLFCRYWMHYILYTGGFWYAHNLRCRLYDTIQKQDLYFYGMNRTGDLMAKMTGDIDVTRVFCETTLLQAVDGLSMLIMGVIYIFGANWIMGLAMLAFGPFITILVRRVTKRLRPMHMKVRDEFSALNTTVQENISGNRVVKAFTREGFEQEKFDRRNDAYRDINVETNLTWLKCGPVVDLLVNVMGIVALVLGGILVITGQMTPGGFVAVTGVLWTIQAPMRVVGDIFNNYQRFTASAEKIMELYYSQPDIEQPEDPLVPDTLRGDITFRNVTLELGCSKVLQDIDLHVPAGSTLGIMGPTGCGKTSLVNLIPRFYDPNVGEVLVDGVPTNRYDLRALRKHIGMTMQDVFLFSDTIEGNIAFGVPDLPMEDVKKAAASASAAGFVEHMPEGYDTIIGERGTGLSGGQKQRLSRARAIAVHPSVMILDDTTSAVDMETEKAIQGALAGLDFPCTKIIIAQRISSLRNADQIIVLKDGRIAERGTHAELLKLGGYYTEIYELQNGREELEREVAELGA